MTKISLLYDVIRWEEKALYEAGKKLDGEVEMIDVKVELFDLSKPLDKKFGETRINNKNIFTYKDYSGIVSRYYPFTLEGELSEKTLQQCWENGGKLTTSFFHSTAKQSFQTLSDLEYCVITKST